MKNLFVHKNFIDFSYAMFSGNCKKTSEEISDLEHALLPLDEVFSILPGCVWWKSSHGIYLGANEFTFRIMGSKMHIGRHDRELPWKDHAAILVENDQKTQQLKASILVEEGMIFPNEVVYNSETVKSPLLDQNGQVVGMIGNSLDKSELEKIKNMIKYCDEKKSLSSSKNYINIKNFNPIFKNSNKKYTIKSANIGIDAVLSYREMQCVYYLFHGRTAKETARLLKISPRTVETYLNNAKGKLRYTKRSELIEILLENILIIA